MRILLDDGMQIEIGTGIGKYSLYLYNELKKNHEVVELVELNQFERNNKTKMKGRIEYLFFINSHKFFHRCGEYDVVHFTNYAMPMRKNKKTKYVVTIHDLASFACPESLPFLYRLYNRMMIRWAVLNADIILTVSQSIRNEMVHRWPWIENKIKVAYPGLYFEFSENQRKNTKYKCTMLNLLSYKKFFLFVGTIECRKNLGIVLRAFINIKRKGNYSDYKLVLAGREGFGFKEYEQIIFESDMKEEIFVTGYLASEDINKLYRDAAAYIFPTLYEGFGSTQLECMINHLPLILSDIPTNREISSNYGLFFNLNDVEELQLRMEEVINEKYNHREKNKIADSICEQLKWENCIQDYIHAYRSAPWE